MSQLPTANQAWVFVGSPGLGKSSHIRLFADERDEVRVSSGAKSCTTDPKLYQHRDDQSIFLLDTVGFEDSTGQSDRHIMSQTLRTLCEKKVVDVKVIWFVKPEIRATSTLRNQAKFINSLLEGRIWQSTFVVVKEGQRKKHALGALESSLAHGRGEDSALPVLMHTCIDWVYYPEDREQLRKCMADMSHEECLKRGFLHESEVLARFRAQLAQTPVARVIAKINKCTRCGQVGDERCMPAKCHASAVKVHQSPELVHEQTLVTRHPGPIENVHRGRMRKKVCHAVTCRVEHWHTRSEWYHPGSLLHRHRVEWSCCEKAEAATGCRERCRECLESLGTRGCRSGRSCGSEEGCEMYYEYTCCGAPNHSQGCKQQLMCCGEWKEQRRSEGCESLHPCCDKGRGSAGCAHACCKQPRGAPGCVEKHRTVPWVW